MLSKRYPTIIEIDGVLADVPHDGYLGPVTKAFDDPAVMATLGGARSRDAAESFVSRSRAHWRDAGFGLWFLRDMSDGGFAGWAGLRRCEADGERTVELAYALTPKLRCKGHATRIGSLALQLGFDNLGLPEVVAFTTPENAHSLSVIDRLEFERDRDFEHGGRPHVLYRRTEAMHRAH
ncbi:GNAT family N-acetyltransferase [Chelatococcus sambhunathii]|uniref:GNAT family N-acetyltransferase n=1 Tax=Chelatococcus sambhunathii TaxID=363953 RepID=A0ABU1DII5_9HYPH|nr:GNAT family protein [Chelatococcus sambhunathii]MDR4307949.1 GNAT family N-acetyltransferase [Chelatococcus sambhunathii]